MVPDVDVIKCWASENGIPGTFSVLCSNDDVKKLIMDDMTAWGKEAGLKSFEQVSIVFPIIFFYFCFSGKRYLSTSGSVQCPKRFINTNAKIETSATERIFQTAN